MSSELNCEPLERAKISPRSSYCELSLAGTEVFIQLLHKELRVGASAFLFFFAGDANAFPGLDAGCVSDQSIGLLVAAVLKLEAVRAGNRTAIKRVPMMNGVEDAESNSRAYNGNGNTDRHRVASRNAPDGARLRLRRRGCGQKQGASRDHGKDFSMSRCHREPRSECEPFWARRLQLLPIRKS
jgi:hypothetical protein